MAEPEPPSRLQPLAEPILASFLLEARLRRFSRGEKVRIGGGGAGEVLDLDEYVLLGGVERGEVVGVSSAGGVGRLLSLHLLTTFLLAHPASRASIIDATGSFPVSLLASVFRSRLAASDSDLVNQTGVADRKVLELLERVSISRAFDLDGVCEVVSEVAAKWRGWENEHERESEVTEVESKDGNAVGKGREPRKLSEMEIGDSEEDDDEEEDFHEDVEIHSKIEEPQEGPVEMIIVDDMTVPISGLFSQREKGTAHTLLAALSRTLNSLSEQRNMLTILINDVATHSAPKNHNEGQNHPQTNTHHPKQPSNPKPSKNPTSIFASSTSRPALGRLFSDLVSLHLLISSVPKTQRDAEILYATTPTDNHDNDDDDAEQHSRERTKHKEHQPDRSVAYAYVLEVLKDETSDLAPWALETEAESGNRQLRSRERERERRRSREQRWGAFVIRGEVGLRDAFPVSRMGNARAEDVANSRYADGSTVHVLKQFPIGKRG